MTDVAMRRLLRWPTRAGIVLWSRPKDAQRGHSDCRRLFCWSVDIVCPFVTFVKVLVPYAAEGIIRTDTRTCEDYTAVHHVITEKMN